MTIQHEGQINVQQKGYSTVITLHQTVQSTKQKGQITVEQKGRITVQHRGGTARCKHRIAE